MATGQPSPLTPALAKSFMTAADALVEPLRLYGAYGPAVEPAAADDDDDVATLLRFLGRRPNWVS